VGMVSMGSVMVTNFSQELNAAIPANSMMICLVVSMALN
jgi:hypothetical protein